MERFDNSIICGYAVTIASESLDVIDAARALLHGRWFKSVESREDGAVILIPHEPSESTGDNDES